MKSLAAFAIRDRSSATLVTAVAAVLFWLFPPFLIVSGGVVALVTLRRSAVEGALLITLSGSVAMGLLWLVLGAPWLMLDVLLAYWLPLWALALVLRSTISLARTIQIAALLGLLGVAGFYWALGDPAIWWKQALSQWEQDLAVFASSAQSADPAVLDQLLALLKEWVPLLPGQVVSTALLFILLALFLGRWWQALLFNPGGFRPEFHQLRLGRPLAVLTLALFGMAIGFGWPVWTNCILVLGVIYTLQGVALVHAIAFKWLLSPAWLWLFYLLLIPLLSQWVMALGVADAWADFRSRVHPRLSKR